jgi:hypothetical protein
MDGPQSVGPNDSAAQAPSHASTQNTTLKTHATNTNNHKAQACTHTRTQAHAYACTHAGQHTLQPLQTDTETVDTVWHGGRRCAAAVPPTHAATRKLQCMRSQYGRCERQSRQRRAACTATQRQAAWKLQPFGVRRTRGDNRTPHTPTAPAPKATLPPNPYAQSRAVVGHRRQSHAGAAQGRAAQCCAQRRSR